MLFFLLWGFSCVGHSLQMDVFAADYLRSKPLKEVVLKTVLVRACYKDSAYFTQKYSLNEYKQLCTDGAAVLIETMDMFRDIPFPQLYETKVKAAAQNHNESEFIKGLEGQISMAQYSKTAINIWNAAFAESGTKKNAIERLALYFQGTVPDKGFFLEQFYSENEKPFINKLNNLIRIYSSRHFLPFIKVEAAHFNICPQKLYHFFSPAYLTQELIHKGMPTDIAIYFGFTFNWIYEIVDDNYFGNFENNPDLNKFQTVKTAIVETSFRERPMTEETAEDVIAGYIGSFFGADRETMVSAADIKKYRELLKINPARAHHEMLLKIWQVYQ
ncbi:MAG: hypothetical protein ACXVCY_15120 [Pseudobdellovibrionaceae bacterium]